jgi:hypothetical protein
MSATAQDTNPAVVIEWNELALNTAPASAGPMVVRYYTIMHIAMFDAVNSIQRRYTPFLSEVHASSGASSESAAAQAAHDVLVALIPGDGPKATFDAALNARLATIPKGRAAQGVAIGKDAAARVLAWRADDGIFITTSPPPYVLPLIPGLWQPAPTGPNFTHLPNATPFTMESITQFAVPRHPELDSARYAADYEEVRLIGRIDSATRTATQTETAKLWAGFQITTTSLMQVWNHVVQDMTLSRQLSLLESARLFAMVNATITDSLLNTFTGKFAYGLWRPVTAIRRGAEDFNDATIADPLWSPLLGSPPYPTYPGNMAGVGACAANALALGLGRDDIAFSVTWAHTPGNGPYVRPYASFSQLAQEEADSRIYGGIHFRFDNEVSQAACDELVAHAYSKFVVPR